MPLKTARIFEEQELPPPKRRAFQERMVEKYPKIFRQPEDAARFFSSIHLPASLSWAFLNNGKAGSSSARRFLFLIEFGWPLTVRWNVPHDINSDAVVHNLQGDTYLLRAASAMPEPWPRLKAALRLTTVRHPLARVVSAFEYLCKSNDLAHSWFAPDRLRMNAIFGFDWNEDPRTARGFEIFLEYILWSRDTLGPLAINAHWRPQIDNVLPDLYRPEIIGRLEDMPSFFRSTAARLERPLPEDFDLEPSNQQSYTLRDDWLSSAARARIQDLYARDFEWLDYEPGEVG